MTAKALFDAGFPTALSDSQATALGLKSYSVGNTYNNAVTLTATGTGFTTLLSAFIPYQMQDGSWRLKFLLRGNTAAGQGGSGEYPITISGVSFSSVAIQGILADQFSAGNASTAYAYADSTTGIIAVRYNGVSSTSHSFSGDVALSSKPTWAY